MVRLDALVVGTQKLMLKMLTKIKGGSLDLKFERKKVTLIQTDGRWQCQPWFVRAYGVIVGGMQIACFRHRHSDRPKILEVSYAQTSMTIGSNGEPNY